MICECVGTPLDVTNCQPKILALTKFVTFLTFLAALVFYLLFSLYYWYAYGTWQNNSSQASSAQQQITQRVDCGEPHTSSIEFEQLSTIPMERAIQEVQLQWTQEARGKRYGKAIQRQHTH